MPQGVGRIRAGRSIHPAGLATVSRPRKEEERKMASRPQTTFKKRQRELARMEKRQEKAARRQQRKLEKPTAETQATEAEVEETVQVIQP